MHPFILVRKNVLVATLGLMLLCLACTRHVPAGRETPIRIDFGAGSGPRTPEGARLEGGIALRVAVTTAAQPMTEAELEQLVRRDVIDVLEKRLREQGIEAAKTQLEADARWILARDGIELRGVDSVRLTVPGAEAREQLAPTTDLRILLVGLDGFDWDIAEPLMAAGRMPALSGLVARGARARLETIQPVLSPVVWTSIATGRSPREHGVLDFLGTDAKGDPVPVTSNLRRKKAFWNVMSDAGVPVGVVGWWATWPAEPVDGFLVSDRVAYQLFHVDATKLPTVGKVHPPALWDEVASLVVKPADVPPREIASFIDASAPGPLDAQDRQLLDQLASVQAQARTYAAISLRLHEQLKPRVGAYYFEAPDTTCHLFMRFAPPALPEIDPVKQRRYAPVVDRTYEFHDRLLARFLEAADDKTVVMVVSDHGFRSGDARPAHDSRVETPTAAEWHERFGVFAAAGPGIRAGTVVPEASVLDVFPTMLALLGMPVARDLEGHVLDAALTPEFLAAHPVRQLDTFETSAATTKPALAEASAEDRSIIESLIAIGYVGKEALGPSGSAASSRSGASGPGPASANVHNNTGTVLLEQGDLDAAVAEFRQAVDLAPQFAPARINLASALVRLGRAADAEAELRAVLAADPANAKALSLLSGMQLDEGRVEQALSLAETAVARDPRSPAAWYTLGQVKEKSGKPDAARQDFARSAALDPDNPEPPNAIGNSHEKRGEHAEAARWYERALHVDPSFAAGYNNLGLEYQRLGRFQDALKTYEEGRRRVPSSSILLNNLATWHHLVVQEQQDLAGREQAAGHAAAAEAARARAKTEADAAVQLYEEAMKANPLDPSAVNNLGALRGLLGEPDKQLALYRRAVEIDPRYADAWHNIGLWYHDREDWQHAHEAFQKVLAIQPDYVASLRFDAHSLLQLGRAPEALRILKDAAARSPRSAPILMALGGLQDEMGDVDAACRSYRASLAASPEQAQVRARVAALCGR